MPTTLGVIDGARLERSCDGTRDWIRLEGETCGVERAEAFIREHAFALHRHDTYAIGMTLAGAQAFRYRGGRRVCHAGQLHVLHPDELHDGLPADPRGFRYRIVYVQPALVRAALGDTAPLPFVADPVQERTPRTEALAQLIGSGEETSELAAADVAVLVADTLRELSGRRPDERDEPIDVPALEAVREHLTAHATESTPAAALERVAGLDRFAIARQFRRAFGTSPDRYRTMRRLDVARAAIASGTPLAAVAADAGFADQSHLTRQFKRAYGVTPGAWAAALARGPSD
jgi:AraC-like DNA-binding protein